MKRTIGIIITAALLLAAWIMPELSSSSLNLWQDGQVTNFPNPFDSRREETTIVFNLSNPAQVRVRIFDLLGNVVREYPSRVSNPGTGRIIWDGTDENGEKVSKGGYLAVVEIENEAKRLSSIRKIGVIH